MRRLLLAALLLTATSCAAPRLAIVPRFDEGDVRTYSLRSEITTEFDLPSLTDVETTLLEARTTIEVVSVTATGATLRVVVTPTRFVRDGKAAEIPEPQEATLTLDARGAVKDVKAIGGAQLPLGGSKEDLGALLGTPIRRDEVKLADRWRDRTADGGTRSSRLASLRFVEDLRCAVVITASEQPAVRQRQTASGTLTLEGTETSATETAFAFDRGYPASIDAHAEGRFSVRGAPTAGSVTIRSNTSLLIRTGEAKPVLTPLPSPSPSKSPAKSPARPTVKATATPSGSPAR